MLRSRNPANTAVSGGRTTHNGSSVNHGDALISPIVIDYEVTVHDPAIYTRPWTMTFPKRRAGTGPGGPRGVTAASLPAAAKDAYANEPVGNGVLRGDTESLAGIRALGYKWFYGVTPPK